MDYRPVTDRLSEAVPLRDLATALGVSHNTVVRAQMDSGSPNARPAPAGWESAGACLARQHAHELRERAAKLDSLADDLRESTRA